MSPRPHPPPAPGGPPAPAVELVRGRSGDAVLEVALAPALLTLIAAGRRGPVLRCYRPPATVAFGRRDSFLPGFAAAARAALRHGFAPVIRAAGGRAAAYDEGSLVLDEIFPAADSIAGIEARFAEDAQRQAGVLRGLGVDARVGELPGEYCPGAFSVNARGATKLAGAAQRIIRGAWQFSTVVVIDHADAVRAVLDDVYGALGLTWDPATVGAVADEVPGVDVGAVERALLEAYGERYDLRAAPVGDAALAAANALRHRHAVAV